MSENMVDSSMPIPNNDESNNYAEVITFTDSKTGIIHRFQSSEELMKWQEEAQADKNNP